ncbi:MAG: hypothetical protein K2X66_03380, partial [Cyanobacteria bacterium]|nr:hypothetical protein [Cyanobacteriota bacterium]
MLQRLSNRPRAIQPGKDSLLEDSERRSKSILAGGAAALGLVSFKGISLNDKISDSVSRSIKFSATVQTPQTPIPIPLNQVKVVRGNTQEPIQLQEHALRFLLEKVQDANQMALAHQKVGNVSGDYFASAVGLEDGTWGVGTNIETSQQDRSCGERVSMLVAWNQSIQKHVSKNPGEPLQPEPPLNPDGMKIKQIIMSKSQLGEHMVPCGECQGWMGTHRYFSPSTQIITLDKISPSLTSSKTWEPPQYKLWIRELQDLLPLWGKQQPSLTSQPIPSLPVHFSPKSLKVLKTPKVQGLISPETIQN